MNITNRNTVDEPDELITEISSIIREIVPNPPNPTDDFTRKLHLLHEDVGKLEQIIMSNISKQKNINRRKTRKTRKPHTRR
jgi:hypothetical protein